MRDHGLSDEAARRVELALTASRVEEVTLEIGPLMNAEFPRALPLAELQHLAVTNPRQMYEYGWEATATLTGPDSRPIPRHGVLFLHEGVEPGEAWVPPETDFSFGLGLASVASLFVYSTQRFDVRAFERRPAQVFRASPHLQVLVDEIGTHFRQHGWDGAGDVGLVWLPPFVMPDAGANGSALWHVRQSDHQTSWLAAQSPLPFPALSRAHRRR